METHIIIHRATRTIMAGIELSHSIPAEEFSWHLQDILKEILVFGHPFHEVRIEVLAIEDIPHNMENILKKIGTSLYFHLKMPKGFRIRKKRKSPWGRKIRRSLGVTVGSFKDKEFIPCTSVFVRFYFRRTLKKYLLS